MLIDALTGPHRSEPTLRSIVRGGARIYVPALVLYEWLRGPRLPQELETQEALFPGAAALPFGPQEGAVAANLHRVAGRARGREIDLAIAAHALTRGASLWTLNREHFQDLPGLELW